MSYIIPCIAGILVALLTFVVGLPMGGFVVFVLIAFIAAYVREGYTAGLLILVGSIVLPLIFICIAVIIGYTTGTAELGGSCSEIGRSEPVCFDYEYGLYRSESDVGARDTFSGWPDKFVEETSTKLREMLIKGFGPVDKTYEGLSLAPAEIRSELNDNGATIERHSEKGTISSEVEMVMVDRLCAFWRSPTPTREERFRRWLDGSMPAAAEERCDDLRDDIYVIEKGGVWVAGLDWTRDGRRVFDVVVVADEKQEVVVDIFTYLDEI